MAETERRRRHKDCLTVNRCDFAIYKRFNPSGPKEISALGRSGETLEFLFNSILIQSHDPIPKLVLMHLICLATV